MSLLNLHPEEPLKKASNFRLTRVLSIGGLIGAIALGSTFAANIGLNGDQNVEFGQGVAQTTACSGDTPITLTPQSSFENVGGTTFTVTTSGTAQTLYPHQTPRGEFFFYLGVPNSAAVLPGMKVTGVGIPDETYVQSVYENDDYAFGFKSVYLSQELITGTFDPGEVVTFSGGGHFVMSSISVSNVPDTCDGAEFTIKSYGHSGELSNLIAGYCFNPYQSSGWDGRSVVVQYDATNENSQLINNTGEAAVDISQTSGGFAVSLGEGYDPSGYCSGPPASDVYRITIESTKPLGGGPLGYGLAFFTNQVFVSTETGSDYAVGDMLSSPTYPGGLTITDIYSHTLNAGDPDGQFGSTLECANNNSEEVTTSVANCLGFHFGEFGFVITLSDGPYLMPVVEQLEHTAQ